MPNPIVSSIMRRVCLAHAALCIVLPLSAAAAQVPVDPTGEAPAPTAADATIDVGAMLAPARPNNPTSPVDTDKKFRDFAEVTRGAEKLDGFFTLYKKDDQLFLEIKPNQFEQPFLAPITIARGLAQAGVPLTREDEMVLLFRRRGDRVQLVRRNVKYKAPSGTPVEKAVQQNYTDSVLMSLPIQTLNPQAGQAPLINLNDIFLTDFAQLGLGQFDRSRSSWSKIKAFPNNLELQVEATYNGGSSGRGLGGDSGIADPRGITVVLHYSLMKLPDPGYKPRYADQRVGHFLSAVKDFGNSDKETPFVRMINRWRLEKADPKAKLSAPKKQIVFYVEDNVPYEYRPYVEEGIREWNKAFEKIGFRDAIAVRWQQPGEVFDPEDTNYNTFRWITTNSTYAMSCLRANPLTGEMIDGDVIFDASWIQAWKDDYALLTGVPLPAAGSTSLTLPQTLAEGEILSPIAAARHGFGMPGGLLLSADRLDRAEQRLSLVPADWNPIHDLIAQRHAGQGASTCHFAAGIRMEMSLAALAIAQQSSSTDKDKPAEIKLPEELIGQGIKEVTMHEIGHSLGLRHNFRASAMLSAEQLNDKSITSVKGNTGSVMDYTPINLAPRGQSQGDYFSTTIGPYDYWAIEYAYKPIEGDETKELQKIASRAPEPDLAFATDEDLRLNNDPLVNAYDLGSDPCRFARDRITLARELIQDLDEKVVKDGESWKRVRQAFSFLLAQWGNAAELAGQHIGGQYVHRHHKADKDARDPVEPVPGPKQREALSLLVDEIFSDKIGGFSPRTLRRLGFERWYHWGAGSSGTVDYPVYDRILQIQRIALDNCLRNDVLTRLQNQELQSEPDANPLTLAELFRTLAQSIWSELDSAADAELKISTVRRNLQREHLRRLAGLVLGSARTSPNDLVSFVIFGSGGSAPADARSLARMHLRQLAAKIEAALKREDSKIDDTTRAHLEESQDRIAKILSAELASNEP
ncbi:MAG: hypothetical protein KatS3mg108_2999 [Isosphaeraceae bacterium]|jgi:hypothetical protein|nr:MAG: hypothetical protein KatS3mg108_2999 [Isosphaeraceae bacterium]